MQILKLLIIGLIFTGNVYADKIISVTLTDEEYKVLEWQVPSPEQWVINAVKGKISKSEARMLFELSDKRPDKISKVEKNQLIKDSTLKTRAQRDQEELDRTLKGAK